MNLVNTRSPNFGSGRTSRLTAARRRDIALLLLRTFRAVFRTALTAIFHTLGIERAPDDVIADAGQVFDSPAADQDHRVFLQVVALARDVARHLEAVRKAHARHLAQSRIGLLRRGRVHARAYPPLLRAGLHRGNPVARQFRFPRIADQLVYRRHRHNPVKRHNRPKQSPRSDDKFSYQGFARPLAGTLEPQANHELRLGGFLRPALNRTIVLVIQANPVKSPRRATQLLRGNETRKKFMPSACQARPVERLPHWQRSQRARGHARPPARAAARSPRPYPPGSGDRRSHFL